MVLEVTDDKIHAQKINGLCMPLIPELSKLRQENHELQITVRLLSQKDLSWKTVEMAQVV